MSPATRSAGIAFLASVAMVVFASVAGKNYYENHKVLAENAESAIALVCQ